MAVRDERRLDGRQLDGRLARNVLELARWWTSAPQEARFLLLTTATKENRPPLRDLHLAIILAETEAGEVEEG
jgi:hypothetical protein